MNWDDAMSFRTVAQELSFSRAAAVLHVTPQALSQRVTRLERRLGVRLLDRTTRRVELTDAGRALLAGLGEMSFIWRRTNEQIAALDVAPRPGYTLYLHEVAGDRLRPHLAAALPTVVCRFTPSAGLRHSLTGIRDRRADMLVGHFVGAAAPRVDPDHVTTLTLGHATVEALTASPRARSPATGRPAPVIEPLHSSLTLVYNHQTVAPDHLAALTAGVQTWYAETVRAAIGHGRPAAGGAAGPAPLAATPARRALTVAGHAIRYV